MGPKKRRAPPGENGAPSESIAADYSDGSEDSLKIDRAQLARRNVRPDELPELRRIWWRQIGAGFRMPAETSIIVLPGGLA